MPTLPQSILNDYLRAFDLEAEPFLTYYAFHDGTVVKYELSRGEFLSLAKRAAAIISGSGCVAGDRILHCLSRNHYGDLAFRLGAAMTGTVPVTVNWQADTVERVLLKAELTSPALIVTDAAYDPDILCALSDVRPDIPVVQLSDLDHAPEGPGNGAEDSTDAEKTRIIIFTSGTTGTPKGVQLPYRSYRANRLTFESLTGIMPEDRVAAVIVNPLHHTNSTAITDWMLRRPGAQIHLLERYSTPYWRILVDIVDQGYDRVLAPTVSRHFDFLADLDASERLPIELDRLRTAMSQTDFLIGSAPVGPTTVKRLRHYAGRIPTVRFGSTETCLQVLGIPHELDDSSRLSCFERGWAHRHPGGEHLCGYYVGRPTPPHTEARIVESIIPGSEDFMVDCTEGAPGYLITRGDNVMSGYVQDPAATAEVLCDGWYLGLKDIAFRLRNPEDEAWDYYWLSRDSAMLIRGGANYAYAQINDELSEFVARRYGLSAEHFSIAVVGLKIDSEHEDSCCVTIELRGPAAEHQEAIEREFLADARKTVSKGARPDRVRCANIPRNFKGAILVSELKAAYMECLAETPAT